MKREVSAIIAGVGGQGVLFASRVLANAAISAGLDAKTFEVRGLAQRYGSVYSFVKMGNAVRSASIPRGGADILLCLDFVESLRFLDKLSHRSTVLLNDQHVPSPAEALGIRSPPLSEVVDALRARYSNVVVVNASSLAREVGASRALNAVMLGGLAALDILPFPAELLKESLLRQSPRAFREINRKAFEKGLEVVSCRRRT